MREGRKRREGGIRAETEGGTPPNKLVIMALDGAWLGLYIVVLVMRFYGSGKNEFVQT